MVSTETTYEIPLTLLLDQDEIADALIDVFSYQLLDLVYRNCERHRSKGRDPSVTTEELVKELGGFAQYHIQIRLLPLQRPPTSLLEAKDEGHTWRVRMTPAGYRVLSELDANPGSTVWGWLLGPATSGMPEKSGFGRRWPVRDPGDT